MFFVVARYTGHSSWVGCHILRRSLTAEAAERFKAQQERAARRNGVSVELAVTPLRQEAALYAEPTCERCQRRIYWITQQRAPHGAPGG